MSLPSVALDRTPAALVGMASAAARWPLLRLPALRAGAYLFWSTASLYFALAVIFVLQLHLIVGDAWSRVGNAYYVFFSRDPHLAAIGFVWNPLPSILEMPFVLLHGLWPPLVTQGFAASLVSVLFMAGAAYQLHGTLVDWRVPGVVRLGLTVAFALHPMVLHYGANGDTEAIYLFLMIVCVRQLARWLTGGALASLVMAGLALGLGYWTRYETVAAAGGVIGLVALVAFRGWTGPARERWAAAAADALIVGAPFVVAFVTWTLASWIIVGNPFEQFSSIYGTSSQLSTGTIFDGDRFAAARLVAAVLFGFAPALVVLLPMSGLVAVVRRDLRWTAPIAVLGPILLFAVAAWLAGKTGGWIRYYITIIPLTVLLGGLVVAGRPGASAAAARVPGSAVRWLRTATLGFVGAMVVAANAVALPTAWDTMRDPVLGRGEHNKLDDLPQYVVGAAISDYLDRMQLGEGEVLVDVFLGFPIVLQSERPAQFVITPDRDFMPAVTDPQIFDVRYILVPPTNGLGTLDAITRQWPGIYDDGASLATLVHEFRVPGTSDAFRWRLYEVIGVAQPG